MGKQRFEAKRYGVGGRVAECRRSFHTLCVSVCVCQERFNDLCLQRTRIHTLQTVHLMMKIVMSCVL